MLLNQKIHLKEILGDIGLLLHIPGIMALITLPIAFIFDETYAVLPFLKMAAISIFTGQLLYRLFYKTQQNRLWDAMISSAIAWLLCPLLGALPFLWISDHLIVQGSTSLPILFLSQPINAFFESISGFTSTGLTMLLKPSELPHTLQWWRSFQEWIGAVGLIVFVLSFIESRTEEYQLYYAETRSERFGRNLMQTSRTIWYIYFFFTVLAFLLFITAGMPIWEAVNHSLTSISTGGFTITDDNFEGYSLAIKVVALPLMIFGAMSFAIHQRILTKLKISELWKNPQNRIFFILLISGTLVLYALLFFKAPFIEPAFQWVSALGTCGFHTVNFTTWSTAGKLFLVVGMLVGGCTGSTVGGIKIRRLMRLWSGVILRLRTLTVTKEKSIVQDDVGISFPESHKSERLYEASILFTLWIATLFLGWIAMILANPSARAIDILFDVTSALSNVGLTTDLTNAALSIPSKIIMMTMMWMGRLEIVPILILILSWPLSLANNKK